MTLLMTRLMKIISHRRHIHIKPSFKKLIPGSLACMGTIFLRLFTLIINVILNIVEQIRSFSIIIINSDYNEVGIFQTYEKVVWLLYICRLVFNVLFLCLIGVTIKYNCKANLKCPVMT